MPNCPLCSSPSIDLLKNYYHCPICDLRFLDPAQHLDASSEKARYDLHNNNFEDEAYRRFLAPLADAVRGIRPPPALGLDFGCGSAPVLKQILEDHGYEAEAYDPFFYPFEEVLKRQYDFICASEVAEHFYQPAKEFQKLRRLLKPNGVLAVMTALFSPPMDFESWYYRKDPTHVAFYSEATFQWIKQTFHFKHVEFKNGRIILLY